MTDRSPGGVRRCTGTDASAASTVVIATAAGTAETPGTPVAGGRREVTTASTTQVRMSWTSSMGRQPTTCQPINVVQDNLDVAEHESPPRRLYPHRHNQRTNTMFHELDQRQQQQLQIQQQPTYARGAPAGGMQYLAPSARALPVACLQQAAGAAAADGAATDAAPEGRIASETGAVSYASLLSRFHKQIARNVSPSPCPRSMSSSPLSSSSPGALSAQNAPVGPMFSLPVSHYRSQPPMRVPHHHHPEHSEHPRRHPQHSQPLRGRIAETGQRPSYSESVSVTQGPPPQPASMATYVGGSPIAVQPGRAVRSYVSSVETAPSVTGDFSTLSHGRFIESYHNQPASPWLPPPAAAVPGSAFVVPGFSYSPAPSLSAVAAMASVVLSTMADTYKMKMRHQLPGSSKSPPADRSRLRPTPLTSPPTSLTRSTSGNDGSGGIVCRSPVHQVEFPVTIQVPSSQKTPPSMASTIRRKGGGGGGAGERDSATTTAARVTSSPQHIQPVNSPRSVFSASTVRQPTLHPGDAAATGTPGCEGLPSIERRTGEATSSGVDPYYPAHFTIGSIIDLGGGTMKRVENLKTEDFVRSAKTSHGLQLDMSTVVHMEHNHERHVVVLGFAVERHHVEVTVEAALEHPFYVVERGWSSCSPDRTMSRYGLPCHRLTVGDRCISLTPCIDDVDPIRTPTSCLGATSTVSDDGSSATARRDVSGVPVSIERSSLQFGHTQRDSMCSDTAAATAAAAAAVVASRPVDYSRVAWSDRSVRSSDRSVHHNSPPSTTATNEGRVMPAVDASLLPVVPSEALDNRGRSALTSRKRRHSDSDARCVLLPPPSDGDERVDEGRCRQERRVDVTLTAASAAVTSRGQTGSTIRTGATIADTCDGWTSSRQPSTR